MVEADFREQVLEAEPSFDMPTAAALVFIDDFHAILGPTQAERALDQRVLPIGRLTMFDDLLRRRLPDVNDRFPLPMPIANLGRIQGSRACPRHPRVAWSAAAVQEGALPAGEVYWVSSDTSFRLTDWRCRAISRLNTWHSCCR